MQLQLLHHNKEKQDCSKLLLYTQLDFCERNRLLSIRKQTFVNLPLCFRLVLTQFDTRKLMLTLFQVKILQKLRQRLIVCRNALLFTMINMSTARQEPIPKN